jgi:hypothetical protein
MRWRWALLIAAGCGRVGFDARPTDAGSLFGAPITITELNSVDDDYMPSLRADGLEILFGSTRPPAGKGLIWDATRGAPDQPWSSLQPITIPGTVGAFEPALSEDGLQLYFLADGGLVAFTDRPALDSPWAAMTIATELSGMTGMDYIGDLRLVMNDASGHLLESTRADRHAMWAAPTQIVLPVAPGVTLEYPSASADGLDVFFETNLTGVVQLAHAVRPALDQPFGPIEVIDVGFPTVQVGDPEVSHDGHTLLFTAKTGSNADYQLYEMTRN